MAQRYNSTSEGNPEDAATETVAPEETAVVADEQSQGGYVKYTGVATRRILTTDDWARVGAKDHPQVEWTFSNGFAVPLSVFSKEALGYLKIDDGFEIVSV